MRKNEACWLSLTLFVGSPITLIPKKGLEIVSSGKNALRASADFDRRHFPTALLYKDGTC
jgi:hypothetical protein